MFRHDSLSTLNFHEIIFYPIILAIGFEKCTLEIPNLVEYFFKNCFFQRFGIQYYRSDRGTSKHSPSGTSNAFNFLES